MNPPDPLTVVQGWFRQLPIYSHTDGLPARGSVAAGLVILERLKSDYVLEIDAHRAKGGAQLQGLTPSAVSRIQERFGETRPLLKEGGRTNRGTPLAAESLLNALVPMQLDRHTPERRAEILNSMQSWLVSSIAEYFNRRRIEAPYDPQLATWANIRNLIGAAALVGKAASAAQYLVGAKLQLRFPHLNIANHLASAADDSTGRSGDFEMGDTAFHVTISPTANVVEKCRQNLIDGKRSVLLVPESATLHAKSLAQYACLDRVFVLSLETFVANNLEELSDFRQTEVISGYRRLLDLYNSRVDSIESDKSLLIEIPPNLR